MRPGGSGQAFDNLIVIACADCLARADQDAYARFFHAMLERGVYLAPSYCEAAFVSTAHSDQDVSDIIAASRDAFAQVKS